MARLRNLGGKKKFCEVLELCYFECYQNYPSLTYDNIDVLELCYFECYQNLNSGLIGSDVVLELCYFECYQN
ncbi:conserved hypothetical protein [Listeria monocytogenes]|nr:hypothetical protein FORC68_2604 [Listeria monocytogenes]CUL92090.1 conserved hypothetical protein [Listeria monocytogenes]